MMNKANIKNKKVVSILSGGNIDLDKLAVFIKEKE